ncbi:MAG: AAA family ATPase, partial [bacterium]|nr:AAA family ATPase [bacterium]
QTLVRDRISINLIGAKGTGKTRLLEDIQKTALPKVLFVNINLKSYVNKYTGLLREVHSQLQLASEVPERLCELFENLEKEPRFYLLFLDNYDVLLNNTRLDGKYDKDFFDDLNFIKNKDNVSLLCTTCEPHNTQAIFIDGECIGNSWLTLEKKDLPELTRHQLKEEFGERLDEYAELWFRTEIEERTLLMDAVHQHEYPYARLSFFISRFNNQTYEERIVDFPKRLKRWQKEFKKQVKNSLNKKLLVAKAATEGTLIATGVKKIKIPILSSIIELLKKKFGL